MSLRSVLILFKILHVETMFGNEGEGFLHACISSLAYILSQDSLVVFWHSFLSLFSPFRKPQCSLFTIPEPTARSAVPGVSPGRGLLIPLGYLHPGKCEHNEVQSHPPCHGLSTVFVVSDYSSYYILLVVSYSSL